MMDEMLRKAASAALLASLMVGLSTGLLAVGAGTARSQDQPKAAASKQGAGIRIVLDRAFVDEFADRVTMETDFVVHRISGIHKAEADGEVHISGVAKEANLPTVAELTNPKRESFEFFEKTAAKKGEADRTVHLRGVWRLWCEHAGTLNQVQGEGISARFKNSNPDHVFEIHPIVEFEGNSLLDGFKPIEGFKPKDASRAITAYENVPCRLRKDGNRVAINTKGVGFNFVDLVVDPDEDRQPHEVADGRMVLCQLRDTEGELIARRRRVVFVKGTKAFDKSKTIGEGRLRIIGIPRINLTLIKWRLDHSMDVNDPDDPSNWDLPYEIVAIGLVKELPAEEDD